MCRPESIDVNLSMERSHNIRQIQIQIQIQREIENELRAINNLNNHNIRIIYDQLKLQSELKIKRKKDVFKERICIILGISLLFTFISNLSIFQVK